MNSALKALLAAALLALLAPPALAAEEPTPAVNVRPDVRRSDKPFTVDLFGAPVELRLGYELSLDQRRNFDLNRARDRNRRGRDQELKVDARWRLRPDVTLFAQVVGISEVTRQPATGAVRREEGSQRGELWALFDNVGGTPLSLQAGRIPLVDKRTWWWDDDLDAVRLMARGSNWRAETGIGRELARRASYDDGIDLLHRGVRRWFGQGAWTWTQRQSLEAFFLQGTARSPLALPGSLWSDNAGAPLDSRLTWLGLRASGDGRWGQTQRWAYWADVARLSGRRTPTRVRAHAIDLGAQWTFAETMRPTLTLAWATGSGSEPGAAVDRNFRQTGLQENKARIGGVKRLRRYGELLDPELSNLRIGTAGIGIRPRPETSVELVWHRYRQAAAAPLLLNSRLSQDPAGVQRAIGQEFDLFFAWRESRHFEWTLSLSRFMPGAAFPDDRRDAAFGIEFGIAINY